MTQTLESPAATPPADPPRVVAKRRGRGLLFMSIPAVVWYSIFTIGPLLAMFYIALLSWRGITSPSHFVGFDNFVTIWNDKVFWTAVRNTIVQLLFTVPIMLPLAFMLGYYVSLKPPGHRVLRVILFTPALVSLSAKAMIFVAIFSPNGLVNGFLEAIGLGDLATPWLANVNTALPTIIVIDLWAGIGFTAILFTARLTAISPEIMEAAELDGAGHWNRMWRVTYPIIKDYFGVLAMLQFLWILFSSAGSILLLTKGGPGNSSVTLSFLMYDKAFTQAQIGYSQAVGVILFLIGIVGMVGIRRAFRPSY